MISEKDKSSQVVLHVFAPTSGQLLNYSPYTTTLQPIVLGIQF
jgi:hypothetical protein